MLVLMRVFLITNHAPLSIGIQRMLLRCEITQTISAQSKDPAGGQRIGFFSVENCVFMMCHFVKLL